MSLVYLGDLICDFHSCKLLVIAIAQEQAEACRKKKSRPGAPAPAAQKGGNK